MKSSLILTSFLKNRELVIQLVRRMIVGRYRGSLFGIAWSLVIPITMLIVYTFVFGTIFRTRLAQEHGTMGFAAVLYTGIIVHAFFSECISRSPGLITGNPQYVKKVLFPLESLSWVVVFTALFQTAVSLSVLIVYLMLLGSPIHATTLYLPVLFLPLGLIALGSSWFLAATSIYFKDINQLIGVLTTILLFISPIFYPRTALPEFLQPFLYLNPITLVGVSSRRWSNDSKLSRMGSASISA